MKTINYTNFRLPDKNSIFTKDHKFTIWLNWDLQYWFSDKKKLLAFIADLNRMLNNNLVEINNIYTSAFVIYRDLWFFMDGTNCNINIADFASCEKIINKIYQFSNSSPRNTYVYKNFFDLIDSLILILSELREICIQKKISVVLMKIDNHIINLKKIKAELENYNPENKTKITE